LIDFLCEYWFSYELVSITWWTAYNVIPSSVETVIWIDNPDIFKDSLNKYFELIKTRFNCPDITYSIEPTGKIMDIIDEKDFILEKIKDTKIWVYEMSSKIPNLVQTSMNLWILRLSATWLELTYLPRSRDMEEFEILLSKLERIYKNSWYGLNIDSKYPGWQDDPEWRLVKIASEEFTKLNSNSPEIVAVHAWLECWALVAWLSSDANAISIWPNMHDIHSVNERVEIASVEKIEKILEGILGRLV